MAQKRQKGLVFLDSDHFFIRKRLIRKLITEQAEDFSGKPERVFDSAVDFNGLELSAHFSSKTGDLLTVSATVPCFEELKAAGAMEILKAKYGDMLLEDPNKYAFSKKWKVTVAVNPASPPGPPEKIVDLLANLGRNLCAAPFERALTALNDGTTSSFSPVTIHYRENEQIFIKASPHVVQVIYSLAFEDQVDRELARVFTVEFAECGRVVQKAPGVNFYPAGRQPDELSDMSHEVEEGKCVGYLVFAVSKMHIDKPGKMQRVCDLLVQFRSYLLYHIKATKTELHSMMRKTYANLIQVKDRCAPKSKVLNIK